MNRIASMSAAERGIVFAEAAERLQIQPVIVEKDFWVCWMLGFLFDRPEWGDALVFKGGTALSKVFGIIRRFSEDIDLSVSPATLGIAEADVNDATSAGMNCTQAIFPGWSFGIDAWEIPKIN